MMPTIRQLGATCLFTLICTSVFGQAQLQGLVIPDVPGNFSSMEELPAAQAVVEGLTAAIDTPSKPAAELVTERYPDGKIKVEREVIQDDEQNYIQHGSYKTYDTQGRVVIHGHYKHNEMDGLWTRIYYTRETALLNKAPFNQGQLPLVSQAHFHSGQLHGKWVIYDQLKRKLSEWEFNDGKRHGLSSWWYANGMDMRKISYRDGTIHGELSEWDRNSKKVTAHIYQDGRRLETKTEYYANRAKKAEGPVLYPKLVLETPDDWQECTLATYSQSGEAEKHGVWQSWHSNGQRHLQGQYAHDIPAGSFTWWHANGQKSLAAEFRDGKRHGTWTWWHPNGLKSIQGDYANDTPVSNWLWWNEAGKVVQRADQDDPEQRQILAMPSRSEDTESVPKSSRMIRGTIAK